MSSDAVLVARTLFFTIWRLFTSWYIPGTNVTPASMGFMVLSFSLVLRFLKIYFMDGGSDD